MYTGYAGLLAFASINDIQNRAVEQAWCSLDILAYSDGNTECIRVTALQSRKAVVSVDGLLHTRSCSKERLCRTRAELTTSM